MKDNAVSPVVAFLLLLMVVVSFISILNAYYIPSLKQQAEIEHLQVVEEHFLDLSTKFSPLLLERQNASVQESVPLGGGAVIFSPARSSGFLEVISNREYPFATIEIVTKNDMDVSLKSNISGFNIIYRPVGNFWINQGYNFTNGALYITKGKIITPLAYTDINDEKRIQIERQFFSLFLPKVTFNANGKNISSLTFDLVNIGSFKNTSLNGNGAGVIEVKLNKSTSVPIQNLEYMDFSTISVTNNINDIFPLIDTLNESFQRINIETNNSFVVLDQNKIIFTNTNPDKQNISYGINEWNLTVSVYGQDQSNNR
jgi:hypothetical protein